LRVYLDTNVYGRPFDDLQQERIAKEAAAAFKLFMWREASRIEICASEILLAEVGLIEDRMKRALIEETVLRVSVVFQQMTREVLQLARDLKEETDLRDFADCLHLASAAELRASYFITCDDQIVSRMGRIARFVGQRGADLVVRNPLDFVRAQEAT
jgi:predicted nucleic acid-binding protein